MASFGISNETFLVNEINQRPSRHLGTIVPGLRVLWNSYRFS